MAGSRVEIVPSCYGYYLFWATRNFNRFLFNRRLFPLGQEGKSVIALDIKGHIYDIYGKLLTKQKVRLQTKKFCNGQRSVKDSNGNTYSITGSLFIPKIIKTASEGKQFVIINESLDLLLIKIPLPWFVIWFFTFICSLIFAKLVKDESARLPGGIPIQFE